MSCKHKFNVIKLGYGICSCGAFGEYVSYDFAWATITDAKTLKDLKRLSVRKPRRETRA